jgi:Holliday junction DNA helicase RuvB
MKILKDIIGQEKQKELALKMISSSKINNCAVESFIVSGPSGCGKTMFAESVANECGSKFFYIAAGSDFGPYQLIEMLEKMKFRDFLFIDEAHSLPRSSQEILFQAKDQKLIPALGESRLDRERMKMIPDFTVVLATNNIGGIRKEIINRFLMINLDHYSIPELIEIGKRYSNEFSKIIDESSLQRVANASKGVAREMKNFVRHLCNIIVPGKKEIMSKDVDYLFYLFSIGEMGISKDEQMYLIYLFQQPDQAARIGVLASIIGTDNKNIRENIEPNLLRNQFLITHSSKGRKLTRKGKIFVERFLMDKSNILLQELNNVVKFDSITV